MTTVFAKTRKGQEEIDQRGGALGPRARRLLILFDGKRDVDALRAMMPDPRFDETVDLLVAGGFVAAPGALAANEAGMDGQADVPAVAEPAGSATADDGPAIDPAKLEMARNFMLNSLRHFNGQYANIDLREQILRSTSGGGLRSLMAPWRESIVLTRMGQLRVEELHRQLGELLL